MNVVSKLLSKLIAGGLSAGIVLAWWPVIFTHDGAASWVWRGVAWTLCYELLHAAIEPLEHALLNTRAAQAAGRHVQRLLTPVRRAASRRPALSLGALAATVLAVPGGLLASGADNAAQEADRAARPVRITKVTKITKVVKPVEKRTIVRRVTVAAAPSPSPIPVAPVTAPARLPRQTASRPSSAAEPAKPEPSAKPAKPKSGTDPKEQPATAKPGQDDAAAKPAKPATTSDPQTDAGAGDTGPDATTHGADTPTTSHVTRIA